MTLIQRSTLAVAVASLGLALFASHSVAVSADAPQTTVIAGGIDNPSGLALQQSTGHIFIAARSGVHRLALGEKPTYTTEIGGFATDIYGKGPKYNIGPLGCAMLGDDHLVVGDGSNLDEKEVVLVVPVGKKSPAKPLTAADAKHTLGPIKAGADSAKGEGNYYGIAVNSQGIYVTCNGDDTKGWVAKSALTDGKPGELKPFIATKVATNVDAPVAITTTDKGAQLVVGQMGEINLAGDSLLTFYDPASGKLLKNYKTGLNDIAGLAYSPSGKLYAVDFSWIDTTKGGLFELTIDGDKVTTKKIVGLDKPTSIVFGKDGKAYVTVFGTSTDDKLAGAVVRIEANL